MNVGSRVHVEILPNRGPEDGDPPPSACPRYPLPCLGVNEPPHGLL